MRIFRALTWRHLPMPFLAVTAVTLVVLGALGALLVRSAVKHARNYFKSSYGKRNYKAIHGARGEIISASATGIIERLPCGIVCKTPFAGSQVEFCRQNMIAEKKVYDRVGPHPRIVKIVDWNLSDCSLHMEHMENGDLRQYIQKHGATISSEQRICWAHDAADALQVLHSARVIHCDISPRNFLLDGELRLKIADFGGSSIDGSTPTVRPDEHFAPPPFDPRRLADVTDDIFGLGSLIYFIATGQLPFADKPSDEIQQLYRARIFPDVAGLPYGNVILQCWRGEVQTAQEVSDYFVQLRSSGL